jgi:hypothetical protein
LAKIDRKNKKKAEAAINEEFELAVKYKKQVSDWQSQLLKGSDITKLLSKRPELTLQQAVELLLEVD